MKILFLADDFPPYGIGGAGIITARLARGLVAAGQTVGVITTSNNRSEVGTRQDGEITIHTLYSSYPGKLATFFGIYNRQVVSKLGVLIDQIKPDIIHAHNIHHHISYYALKLAKRSGAKVFHTAHDAMAVHWGKFVDFYYPSNLEVQTEFKYTIGFWKEWYSVGKRHNPFRRFLIRHYLQMVDKVFPISRSLETALKANGITNMAVIPYGIDTQAWQLITSDDLTSFITKYQLTNHKVILFGGRLSPLKGGDVIIEALALVAKKHPDALLLVAGSADGYFGHMKNVAKKLGIVNHLVVTGWVDEETMKLAYQAAYVCVTPSLYLDAFNLFNIEAMAAGKPVVGTCFGGTPEIVVDNETGYIVNPNNVVMLADRLDRLLTDEVLAKRFGAAGKNRATKLFELDRYVNDTLNFYTV